MRNHILTSLALAVCSVSANAQNTVSLGDSISRRIGPKSTDSIFVTLRDGDYAKLFVSHPGGIAVDVLRPGGSLLKAFIPPGANKGNHPVPFAAEGGGRWIVLVTNTRDTAAEYGIAFKERLSFEERMRPAWQDTLSSPTIERIRKAIEAGNTNTAEFWKTIEQTGTPIVEPADSKYDLVTFLWRGNNVTKNVYVNATFQVPNFRDDAFHRIGESDVWYYTAKIPKGARFMYQLEPNRPSAAGVERVTRQVDPLNHGRKYDCPEEVSTYRCYSVGELPGAFPLTWLEKRAGVPEGTIERKKIHSSIQNVDRDLTVYLPPGYARKGKPNDLVVLFDGDQYLDSTWNGPTAWNNLIAAHRISPIVVVMVENLPGRRLFDLVANAKFGDFMARELAPWIRSNYNVTNDAKRTVVSGASAGGFAATYLGIVHPEVFGNVLSMSGAFWWSPEHNGGICGGLCPAPNGQVGYVSRDATTEGNWHASLAMKRDSIPAKFFLSAGMFEFDNAASGGGILEETRHLRDVLRAKKAQVIFHEFAGGHDGLTWPAMLAEGLQRLLGR